MLRTTVWRSLCLVVVLMFVAGCGSEDPPAGPSPASTITSAGGRASLTMPAGALPPGVSAADIRITELAPADLPQASNGSPVLGGVRLEPDGLVFNTPVTLTLTVPTSSISVPVLVLFNGPSVEVVPDLQIEARPGEGLLTLSAEISHFTDAVAFEEYFTAGFDAPGDRQVRETFNVRGVILLRDPVDRVLIREPVDVPVGTGGALVIIRRRPDAPWQLTGFFFTSGPVTPAGLILDRPPPTTTKNDSFSLSQPLTCESAGSVSVDYEATIFFDLELFIQGRAQLLGFTAFSEGTNVIHATADLRVKGLKGTCNAPPPMPVTPLPAPPPPRVTLLQATLRVPITTYAVTATDPDGGPLSYEWRMAGEACGTPRVPWTQTGATVGPTVQWSHSNDPPDSCMHAATEHDVLTSVTITTSRGVSVQCVIPGSATLAIADPPCRLSR